MLKADKIPEITLQAAGRSFAELWKEHRRNRDPPRRKYFRLRFRVSTWTTWMGNSLSPAASSRPSSSRRDRGKIQGRDGTLRLGLEGKNAPFHLDIMVDADAAELHSLLFRVFKDDALRKELSRVRNIEGELSGRLDNR